MWRNAHTTARAVHDALLALGVSETVLGPLTSRPDAAGRPRVAIPPLPDEDAQRLLAALGPALGPRWAGRQDTPPALASDPA
jgi:hypothetical protein